MASPMTPPSGNILIFLTPNEMARAVRRVPDGLNLYEYNRYERKGEGAKNSQGRQLYDWKLEQSSPEAACLRRVFSGDEFLYLGNCEKPSAFKMPQALQDLSSHGIIRVRTGAFDPEKEELSMAVIRYGETELQALDRLKADSQLDKFLRSPDLQSVVNNLSLCGMKTLGELQGLLDELASDRASHLSGTAASYLRQVNIISSANAALDFLRSEFSVAPGQLTHLEASGAQLAELNENILVSVGAATLAAQIEDLKFVDPGDNSTFGYNPAQYREDERCHRNLSHFT
jgi:hypothetical protein